MNLNSYKVLLEKRTDSLREKLSRRYCPNRKSLSEKEVAELQNEIDFNEGLIKELDNLEYNRKVKVPKKFDEWFNQINDAGFHATKKEIAVHLISRLGWGHNFTGHPSEQAVYDETLKGWIAENKERAFRAVLDGYEVEEEPKYWIRRNDGYLSFVTFSYFAASEIETSPDCRQAILFTFKPQADHMALLVNGTVEEANHG